MNTVQYSLPTLKHLRIYVALGLATSLTACYVVPYNQYAANQPNTVVPGAIVAAPPGPVILPVRLYPSNDTAAMYGTLQGTVTNHLNGRGEIWVTMGDETFRGEATRDSRSSSTGLANGAGNKGGYMSCNYVMNSTSQGRGNCKFNNGAAFTFHLGQ